MGGGISIDVERDGRTSPAPNGFTRYTVDVSSAAGMSNMLLFIYAGGLIDAPATFSVDNAVVLPEPCSLGITAMGAILLMARGRRRFGWCKRR
jgi:hypothetical protein